MTTYRKWYQRYDWRELESYGSVSSTNGSARVKILSISVATKASKKNTVRGISGTLIMIDSLENFKGKPFDIVIKDKGKLLGVEIIMPIDEPTMTLKAEKEYSFIAAAIIDYERLKELNDNNHNYN